MNNKAIKEANVMSDISNQLNQLDSDSIIRVLNWLNSVYSEKNLNDSKDQPSLFNLPSFYAEKEPTTDKEKTLLLSYWLQEYEGKRDVDALTVNRRLEELGSKVQNITRAYSTLLKSTPPLVELTKKSSNKHFGRKFYRITDAGKKYINKM